MSPYLNLRPVNWRVINSKKCFRKLKGGVERVLKRLGIFLKKLLFFVTVKNIIAPKRFFSTLKTKLRPDKNKVGGVVNLARILSVTQDPPLLFRRKEYIISYSFGIKVLLNK